MPPFPTIPLLHAAYADGRDPRTVVAEAYRRLAAVDDPGIFLALVPEAEALAQLTALESTGEYDWYEEGAATMQSRLGYVKERLRLLYVGITRAKRDLIVTWNSGRQGDATPSLALSELMGWWEK